MSNQNKEAQPIPTYLELGLRPPPGVAFIQWNDGSLRIRYSIRDVVPLRETLLALAKQLSDQAIQKLEAEKQKELELQKRPINRLEKINKELQTMKTQTEEIAELPAELNQVNGHAEPVVQIAKVVREFTD